MTRKIYYSQDEQKARAAINYKVFWLYGEELDRRTAAIDWEALLDQVAGMM